MITPAFIRYTLRILAAASALGALALLAVWGSSVRQSRSIDFGRISISMATHQLELSRSSAPVLRTSSGWLFPTPGARIIVEGTSAWHPTTQTATISIGSSAASARITLRVLFIPAWIALIFFLLAAAGALFWSRRIISPGHCTTCGYDLRGNSGPRCPECGHAALSMLQIISERLAPVTTWLSRCEAPRPTWQSLRATPACDQHPQPS